MADAEILLRRRHDAWSLVAVAVSLVLFSCVSLYAQGVDKQKREQSLRGSRMRAQETNVVQLNDGKRIVREVWSQPLVHYKDEPRDILDATLWAYGTPGRPVALQKIEVYRDEARWFYCLGTRVQSAERIESCGCSSSLYPTDLDVCVVRFSVNANRLVRIAWRAGFLLNEVVQ